METLKFWYDQIKDLKKLKINEARLLYLKYLNESEETQKKKYLDNLILGTMYIILNYISRNRLYILNSSLYDTDDFINAFNEVWIEKIKNGIFLEVHRYSNIFTITFFNEVYKKLGGEELQVNEYFQISQDNFIELFYYFICLKKEDKFSFDLFLKKYIELTNYNMEDFAEYYIISNILIFFTKLYNKLSLKDSNFEKNKIKEFIKLFISIGLTYDISDIYSYNMEDIIINEDTLNKFKEEAINCLSGKRKDIINLRFFECLSLEKSAKRIDISKERARQIEAKALRLLRHPSRGLKKYIEEEI